MATPTLTFYSNDVAKSKVSSPLGQLSYTKCIWCCMTSKMWCSFYFYHSLKFSLSYKGFPAMLWCKRMSAGKISSKAEVLLIHLWSASLCANNGRPSLRTLSATFLCDLRGHPDRAGALTGAEGHKGDDMLPGKAATFTQALCMTQCFDFLFGAVFSFYCFFSPKEKK